MAETRGSLAVTVLLVLLGVWLLLQTLVGDLPRRLLSWRLPQQQESGSVEQPDGGTTDDSTGGGAGGVGGEPNPQPSGEGVF